VRVFLETDRLWLRYGVEADADELYALNSDPEVMRYLTAKPTPRALIETEVLPRFLVGRDGGEPRCWIAVEKASGEFIGGFALETAADGPVDEAELGYRLRPSAWGNGYASEGARALIDKGFGAFGLRRIWAQTMAVNLASRRVMEKAGLAYVRTFHLDWDDPLEGVEEGEVVYALTRAQWQAAGGPALIAAPCRGTGQGE
jgi:RimJ/RimL family protein N-acetyltransferase